MRRILELCGRDESLIEYVTDRPGHDRRYSLGSEKVDGARLVGARRASTQGLERTVAWYRDNAWWWEPIRSGAYREYYERQYGARLAPLNADARTRRAASRPAGAERDGPDDLRAVVARSAPSPSRSRRSR